MCYVIYLDVLIHMSNCLSIYYKYIITTKKLHVWITIFHDCLGTILKLSLILSKHYTQFTHPHTEVSEHLRFFTKRNTSFKS